jgi:hypothetical protein
MTVLLGGLSFASVLVILLHASGFDAVAAVRDRSLSDVPEAGLLSDLGIVILGGAGASALYRGWMSSSLPLTMLGLFCCIFALDDAFMLHEMFEHFEVIVFAFYGLMALAIFSLFLKDADVVPWPMVVVISAFATSILVDVFWSGFIGFLNPPADLAGRWSAIGFLLEDVPKFGGIIVLASFAIGQTVLREVPASVPLFLRARRAK